MRRFPPRDPPPRDRPPRRDLPRPEGPFDRLLRSRGQRDPAPFIIGGTVVFLAVVILLVFLLSGVFGGGDGDGTTAVDGSGINATQGEMPALPPGLVALSNFVEFDADGDVSATIALPLRSRPEEEATLGFYTYLDGRWQRAADARLDSGRQRAEADFSPLPQNLAVLRVVAQAYQVAASLPSGGTLHPDAKAGIISPRDYEPLSDGALEGTATKVEVGDGGLLIPTIVGSGEDTAAVVDDILADDSLRQQHVDAIVQLAKDGGFAGIDLEYSSVDPDLREKFTSFAQALGKALRDDGRRLSLTLPPPGPQREAYDWPVLGQAADIIKVLPIADPLGYWETMPDALGRLVEDVDPKKVMLVVSPFSAQIAEGGDPKTLGYLQAMLLASEIKVREPADPADIKIDVGVNVVAVNLAQSEGATDLRWSDDAAALSFSYGEPDKKMVYIENVFSVGFKLELVQAYALGGVSVSDGSGATDVANVWSAVNHLVESGTVTLVRPNGDSLVPRWEAPDGGNLDAAAGPGVIWRADEAGAYLLRMLISDGDRRFGREITIEVKAKPQEQPTPLVTFPAEEPSPTPSPTGATPTPTPDVTAPAKITGLTIDNSVAGRFTLTWNASAAPDLEKYRVYASIKEGAEFPAQYDLVAEVPKGTNAYTDDEFTLPDMGKTYYYVVTAVDTSGNESVPSNVQSGILP
ncbi:MAG: glycosyl hydrolase family 18 protein [Dehalococcoidia bacterium]|nr:glycosyl hydrolase family 18 protein [Dehalococcoidia bacterium]